MAVSGHIRRTRDAVCNKKLIKLKVIFWEFIQNLPLVGGFITGLEFWQQGRWGTAGICVALGSVLGSLIIRFTESKITKGQREPWRVTIANIAVMTLLMLLATAYLSARWSSWITDIVFGIAGGTIVGIVQGVAAKERIGIGHCVALGIAGAIGLVGIRALTDTLPLEAGILIVTIVVTLIVVLVDYGSRNDE